MAIGWIAQLAAEAPVPVHVVTGPDCLDATERLFIAPLVKVTHSPRHAGVLLVAGNIPQKDAEALDRVHDQLLPPRATIRWDGKDPGCAERLQQTWKDICSGAEGEADRLPDTPPNEWKGKGDHGQGGKGMMGGVPYGRPMAMTGEDVRDGLQLDRYTARAGPFAPMLTPGLVLEVTLQGDVIVECHVKAPPYPQPAAADAPNLCAARLLRLLGLDLAADQLIAGGQPRLLGTGLAFPPGLAELKDQGDARARLKTWLSGNQTHGTAAGLFASLVGLEWSEAVLSLSSVTPSALRQAALEEMAA